MMTMRKTLIIAFFTLIAISSFAQASMEDSITWGTVSSQQIDQMMAMAANGHSTSQYYLGRCFFNGLGVQKDRLKAVEQYELAAEKDQSMALYYLGFCYKYGFGVTKNEAKAEQYFGRAVKWFEQETETDSVDADQEKSQALYQKAIDMGNTQAMVVVAQNYQIGANGVADDVKAVELFTKAAEMGNLQAQYFLGMCYLDGTGVSPDKNTAIQWLSKAAEKGLPAAKAQLGQ